MSKTDKDDLFLESFFEAARDDRPEASDALMARVFADAEAELAATRAPKVPARPKPRVWAMLRAAIGGWPAMASMATATVAGVWIGAAAPDQLATVTGGLLGATTAETSYELEDMLSGYAAFAAYEETAP